MVRNVPEQLIPEIKWEPLELDWDITVSLFLGTLYVTNYYPERLLGWGAVTAPLAHYTVAAWWRRRKSRNKQEGK